MDSALLGTMVRRRWASLQWHTAGNTLQVPLDQWLTGNTVTPSEFCPDFVRESHQPELGLKATYDEESTDLVANLSLKSCDR